MDEQGPVEGGKAMQLTLHSQRHMVSKFSNFLNRHTFSEVAIAFEPSLSHAKLFPSICLVLHRLVFITVPSLKFLAGGLVRAHIIVIMIRFVQSVGSKVDRLL